MRHTIDEIEKLTIMPSTVQSIRSKYVLSKQIDGLEKSAFGNTNLSVFMMENQVQDSNNTFQFKLIDAKKLEKEKSDKSFFRDRAELEEEIMQNPSIPTRFYLGNLRQENAFFTLKKDFLCVSDCESNGNLKEISKETLVFLKLLKCETEEGNKRHLPLCLKCNDMEKTKAIIISVKKNVKISPKFINENIVACIHSDVGELLFSNEDSKKEDNNQTNCKIVRDDEKKHLCVSFDGEAHGLIWVNKARKSKKGTCLTCKSIRCNHVQIWNKEMRKEVFKDHISPIKDPDIAIVSQEDKTSEDGSGCADYTETAKTAPGQRLNYPYDKVTQQRMRDVDGSYYDNLIELVSKPEDDAKCQHANGWSADDPVEKGWIYTNRVNIVHSSFVVKKLRTMFYRKTIGDCECILLYDGKTDMLLPVIRSRTNQLQSNQIRSDQIKLTRKKGTMTLVSLSLLADFANEFFKNGTTMRGFFNAYISKCNLKFGMSVEELLSWAAWRVACVEFFNNVLTINEKELFKCSGCGPRPQVLVIDGIAMGLMKSELDKYNEDFSKELDYKSKIDFIGSKFKDRMFIKLSRNRKLIRNAAKAKDWPLLENLEDSDSDPEYEVGEKRKRNEHDEGMEMFRNFVKNFDQSVKPSSAIIMLMENLSSSTSTIGMMQEFDEDLIDKIQLFLKGDYEYNFLSGTENILLNIEVRRKYPILMKILEASADPDGNLGKPVR